jgi:hypothetical protein
MGKNDVSAGHDRFHNLKVTYVGVDGIP